MGGTSSLESSKHTRLLRLVPGLETVCMIPTVHLQRGKCFCEGHNQRITPHGDTCLCRCRKKRGQEVSQYSVGLARFSRGLTVALRPDLYDALNPFLTEAGSKKTEDRLPKKLRECGDGVWYG